MDEYDKRYRYENVHDITTQNFIGSTNNHFVNGIGLY